MNNKNKPISIILDDLKKELANTINNSQLPLCLIEPILKDLYQEAANMAAQQLEQDRINWEKVEDINTLSGQGIESIPPALKE